VATKKDIRAIRDLVRFLDREPSFVSALQEERLKQQRIRPKKASRKGKKKVRKRRTVFLSSLPPGLQEKVGVVGIQTMNEVLKIELVDDINPGDL